MPTSIREMAFSIAAFCTLLNERVSEPGTPEIGRVIETCVNGQSAM
jgi:hypothetical protein